MSPPAKDAEPTAENVRRLDDWLTSIMAFRVQSADRPWLFYEEIDRYLGPWGPQGYPIGYGKKYCVLFWNDGDLRKSTAGAAWVRRTLTLLQETLRHVILERFRGRTLAKLTEPELRRAAFASHAQAYTAGGIALVSLLSPSAALHVLSIAGSEMAPSSPNFAASLLQVGETLLRNVPTTAAMLMETFAGPGHVGYLPRAMAADRASTTEGLRLGTQLAETAKAVRRGRVDHVGLLTQLRDAVCRDEYQNGALTALAGALAHDLEQRAQLVRSRYRDEAAKDAGLLEVFRAFDPRAFQ